MKKKSLAKPLGFIQDGFFFSFDKEEKKFICRSIEENGKTFLVWNGRRLQLFGTKKQSCFYARFKNGLIFISIDEKLNLDTLEVESITNVSFLHREEEETEEEETEEEDMREHVEELKVDTLRNKPTMSAIKKIKK